MKDWSRAAIQVVLDGCGSQKPEALRVDVAAMYFVNMDAEAAGVRRYFNARHLG